MKLDEARKILKENGYLIENENGTLNITQDKCNELAEEIQEETGFFDNEDDCLDFLSDCIGYKEIGEVATELYNYMASIYGMEDDDIEADRADIEVLLKCIEDKFKLNEAQEILKKNGFLMEKHYQNASVSFQDATGQEKTVVLNLSNIGCKANKKEDTKMFVINYFNSRVKGTKITSVELF